MIFSAATFLTGCVYMQSMSTLPLHLGRMSISPQTYGWIISLNGMMIVAFQLPLTLLLSRFDRGSVVAASALVVGAGFGLTAAASSGWHVALTVVVWTIGEMMQASFTAAIVSDLAPPALRGRYFGVWGVCYSLAMTGGTALGGETLARWGGTCLWLGCLAVSCLGAALYFAVRREMSRGRRHEAVGTAAASG
jgi:MFS family permease